MFDQMTDFELMLGLILVVVLVPVVAFVELCKHLKTSRLS